MHIRKLVPYAFLASACLLMAIGPQEAGAKERVLRVFDETSGLAVSEVSQIAQDSHGFLWIGTVGGVFRFDGREMLPWAADRVRHGVRVLSAGPDGSVLIGAAGEPLYRTDEQGVRTVLGPDGRAVSGWIDGALSGDGALWVLYPDRLDRLDRHGTWTTRTASEFDEPEGTGGSGGSGNSGGSGDPGGAPFFRVLPTSGDTVLVSTERSLWQVNPAPAARHTADGVPPRPVLLAPLGRVQYAQRLPDRSWATLTRSGGLFRLTGDSLTLLIHGQAHGRGLAVRRNTIWASIDQYVYALNPGQEPEVVAPRPGMPTGRPLLVDREESLWIGGYRGLVLMPEPETVTWNDGDGLPSPTHCRFVTRVGASVWVGTWYGLGRIDLGGGQGRVAQSYYHSGRFCPDGQGGLWTGAIDSGFVHISAGRRAFYPHPGSRGIYAFAPRTDGSLWLGSDEGLFLAPSAIRGSAPGAPRRPGAPPPEALGPVWDGLYLSAVLEDTHGRLWVACGESVFHAPAGWVAGGEPGRASPAAGDSLLRTLPESLTWIREDLPRSELVNALVETPSGALWASTLNMGVLRRRQDGNWEEIPAAAALASVRTHGLVPSPGGGIWIVGAGSIVRVEERLGSKDGWEVVEELTSWHGIPNQHATDLWEGPDGEIWLATLAGAVEIRPEVRRMRKSPPPVEIVKVLVDGRPIALDPVPDLPFRRNRLEIHSAALSFRDRSLIRYRIRLGPDAPVFDSREPTVRFVDLSPGKYKAEIRASLDGVRWSDAPARLEFHVHRPWYLQGWALASYAAVLAIALYCAHRVRVAVLLRLERQRTRIAMDLHDEMGSGLGSIGILAGLAAGEGIEEKELRGLAGRIAQAAGEMGGALTDIVWSLRPGTDTLESLQVRLAERAARLLPGSEPRLTLRFPEPNGPGRSSLRLDPEVQRNVQLIATEALHNAVRHSGASHVELGLEQRGKLWRLWVADDGSGIPDHTAGGQGLRNMRSRAAAIGAEIVWTAQGGTTVELFFRIRLGAREARAPRIIMRVLSRLRFRHSSGGKQRRFFLAHRHRRG